MHRHANRLQQEKSPYLQQHAFNPVDWYPWGPEAFGRARQEMKPVFLSVGYSTCHWCHVMERESFEDEAIAALLNEHFVSIKVDREERPEIDRLYMTALQAMGQQGGWPMSMFLTPDGRPFFGGTYFPPETRYGRAGFPEVLRRVHQVWTTEREAVLDSAGQITQLLEEGSRQGENGAIPASRVLDRCYELFAEMFDPHTGGFGGAPKFPRPSVFEFLLRYYRQTGTSHALEMVERTVAQMARGGMTDQVGGGFHRYAVDAEWRVPHFEKMLYDQAQLSNTLTDLFQLTGNRFYRDVLRQTLQYVERDLTGEEGGFYSAEDADSPRPENPEEMGEGAFYVWSAAEIRSLLGDQAEMVSFLYGVDEWGNAPVDPQHEFTGKNILYQARSLQEAAERFGRDRLELEGVLENSRSRLLEKRGQRPRPRVDDKIIASWNGLMIGAFARASWVLQDPRLLQSATRASTFVLEALVDRHTWTVRRRFRSGEARFDGQLDDYMALAAGLLAVFETSGEARWLEASVGLTDRALELFAGGSEGALFDSPGTDPTVLVRMREQYDGAEPAGNSLAALHLLRLSQLTGATRWRDRAGRIFQEFSPQLERQPAALPYMLSAVAAYQTPGIQIVLTGEKNDPVAFALRSAVRSAYLPSATILLIDDAQEARQLVRLIPWVEEYTRRAGTPQAYVCQNFRCELPTARPEVLRELLGAANKNGAGT